MLEYAHHTSALGAHLGHHLLGFLVAAPPTRSQQDSQVLQPHYVQAQQGAER